MNTQRWLALAIVGSIVAAILTRPLWVASLRGDGEDDTAATEATQTPTPASLPVGTPDATLAAVAAIAPTIEAAAMMAEGDDAMMDAMDEAPVESGPFILARGEFVEIDTMHRGEGTATIYQAPDSSRFVHLEPFEVTDSPDLHVLLATNPAPRTQADLSTTDSFIDLGPLRSRETDEEQNYQIPANVRLEQFESVVIYDRTFNIVFTTATLER